MTEIKLYAQDSRYLVVDKPIGRSVHGDHDQSVTAILRHQLNADVYPCHRLDRDTSGLLLLALDSEAAAELSQQFYLRRVQKYYFGVTASRPSKSQGKVIGDLHKSRNGSYKLARTKLNPSMTYFFSRGLKPGYRALLFKPVTGQTHQLRVVAKSLGAPLLGDQRYGGAEADRMYLHAAYLSFEFQGQHHDYYLPPADGEWFEDFLNPADDPWLRPDELPWPR